MQALTMRIKKCLMQLSHTAKNKLVYTTIHKHTELYGVQEYKISSTKTKNQHNYYYGVFTQEALVLFKHVHEEIPKSNIL